MTMSSLSSPRAKSSLHRHDNRRQLTSVDAAVVVLDEYHLMGEGVFEGCPETASIQPIGLDPHRLHAVAARGRYQWPVPAVGPPLLLFDLPSPAGLASGWSGIRTSTSKKLS